MLKFWQDTELIESSSKMGKKTAFKYIIEIELGKSTRSSQKRPILDSTEYRSYGK